MRLQFYEKVETTDEVMGVKFTADGQFFVFSLLDSTLKVCYVDSMKLLLNLYGHKLPVLSFDISSDGTLTLSKLSQIYFWAHVQIFPFDISPLGTALNSKR